MVNFSVSFDLVCWICVTESLQDSSVFLCTSHWDVGTKNAEHKSNLEFEQIRHYHKANVEGLYPRRKLNYMCRIKIQSLAASSAFKLFFFFQICASKSKDNSS